MYQKGADLNGYYLCYINYFISGKKNHVGNHVKISRPSYHWDTKKKMNNEL